MSIPAPISILKDVLHADVKIAPKGGSLLIEEKQPGAAYPSFELKANVGHVALALERLERRGNKDHALPWFDPSQAGFCSKCDAIIFCAAPDDSLLVVCVELKSGNPGDALDQIKSGRAVARFIVELLHVHRGLDPKARYVGLLVTARKMPKKGKTGPFRLRFQDRDGMAVAEWDHGYPLNLSQIADASSS
ncbi:MAG: hypothetical protein WCR07_14320 [Verrucomicrobiota bacterium]|jgi:hypothetical protein